MPQFDTTTFASQIFWLLISWGIIFIYLWKFLIPRMNAKLFKREDKIKTILEEANHIADQAEKMIKLYDKKIAEVKYSQKEKLKKVIDFIQRSRVELEVALQKETDVALQKLTLELQQIEHKTYKDISTKLEDVIVPLIEKKAYVKIEENYKISQLLEKEIKKVTAND